MNTDLSPANSAPAHAWPPVSSPVPTEAALLSRLRQSDIWQQPLQEVLRGLPDLLLKLPAVVAGAISFEITTEQRLRAVTPLVCRASVQSDASNWQVEMAEVLKDVLASGEVRSQRLKHQPFLLVAGPVTETVCSGALCVFFDAAQIPEDAAQLLIGTVLEMAASKDSTTAGPNSSAAAAPKMTLQEDFSKVPKGAATSADVACLRACCKEDNAVDAYRTLANQLKQRLPASRVILGTTIKGQRACRLQAISGPSPVRRPSPLVAAAETVLSETVLRGEPLVVEKASADQTSAQRQLLDICEATGMVCAPLTGCDENWIGAWIVLTDQPSCDQLKAPDEATCCFAALGLDLVRRLHVLPWRLLWNKYITQLFTKSKRTFWTVALLAIVIMFIPLPHKVRCRSELQPVLRRYVPAPYEGTLDTALVEPGDLVEKGQVIAKMDSREIEWQLAAERADYQRARKERDVAMSMRDTAAAQVAGLDMDRVSGQIEILENRLDNLEIKSPIKGVVLSGDPKKLEGARLALGQNLFEIGPLDELVMEVEIPDREIAHVKPGQTTRTRLEAFPSHQLNGVVQRINPRSETRHHANVFVAEVTVTNPDQQLRPGMEGRSRISTAYHTLGWIVFHRLYNKMQLFFG